MVGSGNEEEEVEKFDFHHHMCVSEQREKHGKQNTQKKGHTEVECVKIGIEF